MSSPGTAAGAAAAPMTANTAAGSLAVAGRGPAQTAVAAGTSAGAAGARAQAAGTRAAPSGSASAGVAGEVAGEAAGMRAAGSGGMARPSGAGVGGTVAAGSAGTGVAGTVGMPSGACEFPEPPSDVSGWVDESWKAQLGDNINKRKAWLLDNVMLNKGSLNVCVRWGATSAMPDSVRMNLAATTERWINDWFKGLNGYGCFPYGSGITVKITGYAVRPGKQSLLGAVDTSIPVYTETDADGEPKCPDACSSFVHWDHQFSGCMGGDAAHSDYWLWFDDKLPGNQGAAAVGGDWGLRMPVSTFLDAFDQPSFHITEHEMGHGFGIQDYYDWTGSKPKGGSIMIVGSTQSQPPTTADIWLLKRTWKEMKKLRHW